MTRFVYEFVCLKSPPSNKEEKMLRTFLGMLIVSLIAVGPLTASAKSLSPEKVEGATTVDAAKAKVLFDQGVAFVDTRNDTDWEAGRIPDAIHLDIKKKLSVATLSEVVKRDEAVVMYCNGPKCLRSSQAAGHAVSWGFSKVYYLRTGFPSWKSAGYPVE